MPHLKSLTQLERFDVRGAGSIPGSRVLLLPHMTFLVNLRYLNLSWMRDVQDNDIIKLGKYLTSLQRMTLSGLSGITAATLRAFSSASKLTRLGLYGCTQMKSEVFTAIQLALPQLKRAEHRKPVVHFWVFLRLTSLLCLQI